MTKSLTNEARAAAAADLLRRTASDYAPAIFACSFGAEDMVLVDLIASERLPIDVVTLDTGRLPDETHALIERTHRRYGLRIGLLFPERVAVEAVVGEHGVNGFYQSVAARHACCNVRKVQPLTRALAGRRAWVTGLRREQSADRAAVQPLMSDPAYGVLKVNPLADWTHDDVWSYIRQHDVPYNALHDRGYPSIGCAPCTRAVAPGEDLRAGRWWWEQAERKECGLHPRVVPLVPARANAAKEMAT
jgi:phosphoadenosine phosphosulfate reductase